MKNINFLLLLFLFYGCENINKDSMSSVRIDKQLFGETVDGIKIHEYTLKNKSGMEISIIEYGGIITSWKAGDREGVYEDVVLGFDKLSDYENKSPYFGALIGRYGNRIADGKFSIENKNYTLERNNNENHLHGGLKGFDKVVWEAKEEYNDSSATLSLKYLSEDMEEGYPGNLDVTVTYSLNNDDELSVRYEAKTDKITIINLTQHSYFNLTANFSNDILNHKILINADSYLPVDPTLIPTGELREVIGTPFNFLESKRVGKDIDSENRQLEYGNGYDHCWVINDQNQGIRFVASAYEEVSGRLLEVFSDQPGLQFYSGNFLDGSLDSKGDGFYNFRTGFCLETQHYPNSPNEINFPSTLLQPGERYLSETIFRFSVK